MPHILKLVNIVQEQKNVGGGFWRGNTNDCTQAENLFRSIICKGTYILADRAYDTDKIIDYISLESAIIVIPS